MGEHTKLIEKWSWDKEVLGLFTLVPTVLAIGGILFLYPVIKNESLAFLIAIPCGIFFSMIYGFVGSRVKSLRNKYSNHKGLISASLMQIGIIQSPGIVILEDITLMLVPIVGKECIVQLSEISKIHEGKWLSGKYLLGKRAFNLLTPKHKRLAFAVPESIGTKWSKKLETKG